MYPGQNVPPQYGQGWSGPPVGPPADLGQRFLARLVDSILLGIVSFFLVTGVVVAVFFAESTSGMSQFGGATSAASFVAGLVGLAISLGYAAGFESSTGQTLGKMMLGIQVRVSDGGYPSFGQAVKRNAWMALTVVPVLGGLAWFVAAIAIAVTINSNRNGAGWHDDLAGTRVFRTR